MLRYANWRNAVLLTATFLIHWNAQAAECVYPNLPDPIAGQRLSDVERFAVQDAYQTKVHKFIICQRDALSRSATKLAPSDIHQAILEMRAAEDRTIAELLSIHSCYLSSRWTTDPAHARERCKSSVETEIRNRAAMVRSDSREFPNHEVSAYGGIWSYRTLDFGRPGSCSDAPCNRMFAVEIANWTSVTLSCNATLKLTTDYPKALSIDEQTVILNPGDSLPAAHAIALDNAASAEPIVTCQVARPLPPPPRVPENCNVNWIPRHEDFPRGFARRWMSGRALIEFSAPTRLAEPKDLLVTFADDPAIESAALNWMKKIKMQSNCAGQRFRIRVEYRPFSCAEISNAECLEGGVVTVLRDG